MAGLRQAFTTGEFWQRAERPQQGKGLRTGEPFPGHRNGEALSRDGLTRVVEHDLVPRLILAGRSAMAESGAGLMRPLSEDVVEFAHLSLVDEPQTTNAFLEKMLVRGTQVETLYLDLLAPAARHLGDLWVADICSFGEVTLGLLRLQRTMRALSPAFQSEAASQTCEHHLLLTPVPGEQHSFGSFMVAEFFHRAGWQIWSGPVASVDALTATVGRRWFSVAGLSVSSDAKLTTLEASIRAIRRASRNPDIGVMVGGPMFSERPEMVQQVGADMTAADGRSAVGAAEGLLALKANA
jgi:methanogenic corrinoid protein MtbC1